MVSRFVAAGVWQQSNDTCLRATAGEGKSLTGLLPAYLNVLTGKTVYIATVSDYLAKRDCDTFEPVYEMLGVRVRFLCTLLRPGV